MSLIKNIIRSNGVNHLKVGSQFLLRQHFSTQSEQQQQQQLRLNQDKAVDGILRQPPTQGSVYAMLSGIRTFTTKTDVMNLLESCNLTREDIKVQYNQIFVPVCVVLQLPSHSAYNNAVRDVSRKGLTHRIQKVERDHWGFESYDGKVVLIQGVPRQAIPEDIERMLSGCDYNAMQIFWRRNFSYPMRFAMVQFPSQIDAVNAVLEKNRSFCLSTQISMRVLQ